MRLKNKWIVLSFSFLILFFTACRSPEVKNEDIKNSVAETDIKIAAVGDSITDEFFPRSNYPFHLGEALGSGYAVFNFGESNYAVQSSSDFPYMTTDSFKESINLEPNIVIIMLGTNDTKANNWEGQERFQKEYTALIETYLELESVSRIILASPPTVFLENVSEGSIDPEYIAPIREAIQTVAEDYDLEYVDMTALTENHSEWFFDGVHPTPKGTEQIAQIFYEQIVNK